MIRVIIPVILFSILFGQSNPIDIGTVGARQLRMGGQLNISHNPATLGYLATIVDIGTVNIVEESVDSLVSDFSDESEQEMIEENIQVNQVNEFFKTHRKNYEKFVLNEIDKTKPEKCSFCQICQWKEECDKIWIKKDYLRQIGGLTKVHLKKLLELKIDTGTKLSKQDIKKKIKGFRKEISHKLITQAKLQKEFEKNQKPIFQINERNLNSLKGFNLLPQPSESDLFFDIDILSSSSFQRSADPSLQSVR